MAGGSRGVKSALLPVLIAVFSISLALSGLSPRAMAETVEDSSGMGEPAVVEDGEGGATGRAEGDVAQTDQDDVDGAQVRMDADEQAADEDLGEAEPGDAIGKGPDADDLNKSLTAQGVNEEDTNGSSDESAEPGSEDLVASGEWGTCCWSIDSDGLLRIWPMQGEEGKLGESTYWDDVPWYQNRKAVRGVTIERGVYAEGKLNYLFYGCNLTEADVSLLDTSSVTSMYEMFDGCSSLASLDLSGWDTSSVTNTSYMFNCCSSLATLDPSGWDTSSVTSMCAMFSGCSSLASLDLSGWDTSSVTNTSYMFNGCSRLASLDPSGWDTSSVTSMSSMFYGCSRLASLDPSCWDTSSVTDMSVMFSGCSSLASLDLSGWDTSSVTSICAMFNGCSSLASLDLSGWDTSSVTDTSYMFNDCSRLASLDLSGWDTSSVTSMSGMFYSCSSLSCFSIGARYDTGKAFPGSGSWWSDAEERWFTVSEIKSTRSRVADTYWKAAQGPSMKKAEIVLEGGPYVYDGSQHCPGVTASYGSATLKEGVDYSVEYGENTDAGKGTLRLTGMGSYRGTRNLEFDIERRAVTVRAPSVEKAYGEDDPELSATVEGLVEGDSVDYALTREPGEGIGTYAITPAGEELQGNYRVEYVPGTMTIGRRAVTVTANSLEKVYGEDDPELSATVKGLVEGDSVEYGLSREPGEVIGTYAITVTGEELQGNYRVEYVPGKLSIKLSLSDAKVATIDDQEYCGKGIEPVLSVEHDGKLLVREEDYEISFHDNVDVGTARATLSGIGTYTGACEVTFVIVSRSVTVRAPILEKSYGTDDPELTATVDNLVEGDTLDYVVSRESGESLGTYAVTVTGEEFQGNYRVSYVPGTLTVARASVAGAEISETPAQLRTGRAIQPKPTVTLGGKTLVLGTDYTLSYRDNVEAGTATIIVRGAGNYTGEATSTFRIGSKSIADCAVMLSRDVFLASEVPAKPSVDAYEDPDDYEISLSRGVDFEVSYANNESVGEATATVTGLGDYVGTVTLPFRIVEKINLGDIDVISLYVEPYAKVYQDGAYTPPIKARLGSDPLPFVEGRDYTVTYYNNARPGLATAVVKGLGSFTGTAALDFRLVNPAAIDISGEDVYLSKEFDTPLFWFQGAPVYLWRDGEDLPEPELRIHVTDTALGCGYDLERGVHYELRYVPGDDDDEMVGVSLMVVGIEPVEGVKGYSYMAVKRLHVGTIGLSSSWLEQPEYLYEGGPVEPKLRARPDFVEGVDYELEYLDNTGVGTCRVLVIGKGQFYGTDTIEVPIVESYSAPDLADCTVEIAPDQWTTYTGYPLGPEVRVTDPETGRLLERDADYTLVYENNVNVGVATVKVLPCTLWWFAPYQGQNSITFAIKPSQISNHAYSQIPAATYTGKPLTPNVSMSDPITDKVLVKGTDYTLSYKNNVSAGTATVTITGKGNYAGTIKTTFKIKPASVSKATVSEVADQKFSGKAIAPRPTVKVGTTTLKLNTDYTLSYKNNTKAGTATVTIAGKGNYAGTKAVTFKIKPASLSGATVGAIAEQGYTGAAIKPTPAVKLGSATLKKDTDYTLSYKANTKVGTATVTVTGKGNYAGTKSVTFKIVEWVGASRIPVSASAKYTLLKGGYMRVKSGGKYVKSDAYVSISGATITGRKAGKTTVYLFDSKGKQIQKKTVEVFAAHAKTFEFESSVDKNYVLDIQGGSKKDGAQMIVYKRNNGKNQRYTLYLQSDGTYAIKSVNSGRYLTVEPKTNKYVQQWAWKGTKAQRWRLTVDSANRATFVNVATGKCFDVQGGKTKNSAKMIVWQSNNGLNQKWKLNQK